MSWVSQAGAAAMFEMALHPKKMHGHSRAMCCSAFRDGMLSGMG